MPAKRGDRAAPPPRPEEYDIRFANSEAAKGWEELCRQAPGNTRTAYEAIRAGPRPASSSSRHHRLRHDRAWGTHDGKTLEQWQYEVTGGGRIWYLADSDRRIVWLAPRSVGQAYARQNADRSDATAAACGLTYAGTGHPKATDR